MTCRRQFLAAAAAPLLAAPNGWTDLFDGKSLEGWKAGGNAGSWKVRDGMLLAEGPVSHLFHVGRRLLNFEFECDVLTWPGSNSGIYFHTEYQEAGFPGRGWEVQINNTATGEGSYRELKRTGSLYGLRNVPQQLVRDGEWFRVGIAVRGSNVQVRVNGMVTVDYTHAGPMPGGRMALQCHDAGSRVAYRQIRVRVLPDQEPDPGPAPVLDDTGRRILELSGKNYPLVDWHVHLKPGLDLGQALERSRRDGIYYGISANCGRQSQYASPEAALGFARSVRGNAAYVGFQAEGADWMGVFPEETRRAFDYVFNDGLIWTGPKGEWRRIYRPADLGEVKNAQAFLDEYTERQVNLIEGTPMDIFAIATYLPPSLEGQREALWTEARMKRVVEAAARRKVAIEINDRFRLPGLGFLRMAKEAGCRFALGTGNESATDLRRCEYGLGMIGALQLGWKDLWMPEQRGVGG
jgi:hypothetical protein